MLRDTIEGETMTQRKDTPEKRLWNAVILLAAQDAKAASRASQDELNEWVYSHDFELICEHADQDVANTRQCLLHLLSASPDKSEPKTKPERITAGSAIRTPTFGRSAKRTRKGALPSDKKGKQVG